MAGNRLCLPFRFLSIYCFLEVLKKKKVCARKFSNNHQIKVCSFQGFLPSWVTRYLFYFCNVLKEIGLYVYFFLPRNQSHFCHLQAITLSRTHSYLAKQYFDVLSQRINDGKTNLVYSVNLYAKAVVYEENEYEIIDDM